MLNRRSFIGACCCAMPLVSSSPPTALGQPAPKRNFICSTLDTVDPDPGFVIVPFGAKGNNDGFDIETTRKSFNLSDYGTAFLKDRWLPGDGLTPKTGTITLGVFFMDGSPSQHAEFRSAAEVWPAQLGGKLAFNFDVPQNRSQIRITFNTGVNESFVGRNCLSIKLSSPTMWIGDVIPHVIQHECGHALGLQHEHQNPNRPFNWNRQKVFGDMEARGWSREQAVANILERYKTNAACVGDPGFNENSIMLYPIPPDWTDGTFSSGENTAISSRDVKCLASLFASKA